MTLVVATGVFEILHPGHIMYLNESRKLGDRLVVILASDEVLLKRKGRVVVPARQRIEVLKALKVVDDAVVGDPKDFMLPICELKPDIVTLGHDQDVSVRQVRKMLADAGCGAQVVRIRKKWVSDLDSSGKIKRLYYKIQ
ncbi:adenylyltransferase/cytidyltransferase family protein [Candidatus Altiarchaeota archaeon]